MRGGWVPLIPKTCVACDRGPVIRVTVKVLELQEPKEEASQGVQESGLTPSAPAWEDLDVKSEDSFNMDTVGQGVEGSGSAGTSIFAIDPIMRKLKVNLWPDDMVGAAFPTGLPYGPCRNYNALAVGFDWSTGAYSPGAVGKNMPTEFIPKDIDGIMDGLKLYKERRGVEESCGLNVIMSWVDQIKPATKCI